MASFARSVNSERVFCGNATGLINIEDCLLNKVDSVISEGLLGTIGNTPLIELKNIPVKVGVRFFVKLEGNNPTGSVKDRIAKKND